LPPGASHRHRCTRIRRPPPATPSHGPAQGSTPLTSAPARASAHTTRARPGDRRRRHHAGRPRRGAAPGAAVHADPCAHPASRHRRRRSQEAKLSTSVSLATSRTTTARRRPGARAAAAHEPTDPVAEPRTPAPHKQPEPARHRACSLKGFHHGAGRGGRRSRPRPPSGYRSGPP